jgi:ribonuclease BN (tRNA processing enzyme)
LNEKERISQKMQLLILGCGTILQKGTSKNCSGYLVDNKLLFDCGAGIWRSLLKNNITISQLNYLFLTHFHVDHTSDIAPLLLNRYLLAAEINSPFCVLGPPGLVRWFSKLTKLYGNWMAKMKIDLIEIQNNPVSIEKYKIYAYPTRHTDHSLCYRVEHGGKQFFYSGDTGYDEQLSQFARGCDLCLLEASNTPQTRDAGHLTPEIAGKIAHNAQVKKLLLTHIYPEALKDNPVKKAKKFFSGEVLIAYDDLILEI